MTTTVAPTLAKDVGRARLYNEVLSEWTKFRSIRSTWISLAVLVVAGLGLSALVSNIEGGRWATFHLQDRAGFDPVTVSQTGVLLAQFVVGVLGALIVTSEYSTGLMRTTLAIVPKRTSVLAAKAIVLGAVIFVVSEIIAFAAFLISEAILVSHGGKPLPANASITAKLVATHVPTESLGTPGVARAVFLSGMYLTLLALFALGLGFILRHTAGAISVFVGVLLVLPLILQVLPSSFKNPVEPYMPSNLGQAMVTSTHRTTDFSGTLLSPWPATVMLAIYAAGCVAIAVVLLLRRDA